MKEKKYPSFRLTRKVKLTRKESLQLLLSNLIYFSTKSLWNRKYRTVGNNVWQEFKDCFECSHIDTKKLYDYIDTQRIYNCDDVKSNYPLR